MIRNGETGVLLRSAEQFVHALHRLVQPSQLHAIRDRARAHVAEAYSMQRFHMRLTDIYHRALANISRPENALELRRRWV